MINTMESIYKTMHWSLPNYQRNNQGMAVICDWLHLLKDENGNRHNPWRKRKLTSVIEVGCGNGKLCRLLSDLKFEVTGIDIVDGPYERGEGYEFFTFDITQTPWLIRRKGTYKPFDYCISFDVLEHIAEAHIPDVLQEMGRTARNIILKVACTGEPPLHLCVRSAGWWLNQLTVHLPNFNWEVVRLYNMYPDNAEIKCAPLFYGKKEPK